MHSNRPPSLAIRIYSVWFRHVVVYTRHLLSNGLPPFLEPVIFLLGIGLGLGKYIVSMDGVPYIEYLAIGLLMISAMFTASFECTYGTYFRLEFERIYDGILAAPITVANLFVGEIIWAGTKGLFFSFAVWTIVTIFGVIPFGLSVFAPLVGLLTGMMFGALSLFISSFVTSINQFNFYMTGFLSPMFFFSGVVFPLSNLPESVQVIAEFMPLTHSVRLVRAICSGEAGWVPLADLTYCILLIVVAGHLAIRRMTRRIIN